MKIKLKTLNLLAIASLYVYVFVSIVKRENLINKQNQKKTENFLSFLYCDYLNKNQ
jgi:hypothetical protein